MKSTEPSLPKCLEHSPVQVEFGAGCLTKLGALAKSERFGRTLLVTDPGIIAAGHVARALDSLYEAGIVAVVFDGARENPTTDHVAAGVDVARSANVDSIVGLGGGSAMDCAKGINLIVTNGGAIADYWGEDKTTEPMLPTILVPATAGTGSEAQSFALISNPDTGRKMACGDRRLPREGGLRPIITILDPKLTATQPPAVAAAAGIDAVAHAVETAATTRRTGVSREFSRHAWALLDDALETALQDPSNGVARAEVLLAAHLSGAAIEQSMLGAAHACANPLTARFKIVHGQAVGLMLPHVVRFNAAEGTNPYSDLCESAEELAAWIEHMLDRAGMARCLQQLDVPEQALPGLVDMAAEQWTASFNPRQADARGLLTVYQAAWPN